MIISFDKTISETEIVTKHFRLNESVYTDYDNFKLSPLLEHFLMNEISKGNILEVDETGNPL
jgi:hypothetical protein